MLAASRFDAIYREHAPTMRHIAVRRFRVCPSDAEALVHDVFLAYLANPGVVRGELRPYFAGAMWNAAQNYHRKRKPEAVLRDDVRDLRMESVPDRLATDLALATTLERISGRCREVLRRHHVEGENLASIAAALELSPAYVKVLLHRCRERACEIFRAITRVKR
jgi:RNA polymerase sigma factor (sigma-70 family)